MDKKFRFWSSEMVGRPVEAGVAQAATPERRAIMSELLRLVQNHIDRWGVKKAEFARRVGSAPQTLYTWAARPLRQLPDKRILEGIAREAQYPYWLVVDAALIDSGYRRSYPDVVEICERLRMLPPEDCREIARVAVDLAANAESKPQRTPGNPGHATGGATLQPTQSHTADSDAYWPSPWIEDLLDGGRQQVIEQGAKERAHATGRSLRPRRKVGE
ncbi:hypothetical protein [Nocardia brasiliensis]|uniref:hypothetical protein n=1 Tax=Nocardia brasiliensis TaxID=37326 RepID=UPI00366A8D1F